MIRIILLLIACLAFIPFIYSTSATDLGKWASENGVEMSGIEFANFDDGHLGFRATEEITGEKIVLKVPTELLITLKSAVEGKCKPLFENVESLHPTYALALHILASDLDANSPLKSWLGAIPRELDTPLFWSQEELDELKGTSALTLATMRRNVIDEDYQKVIVPMLKNDSSNVFPADWVTLDRFRWAVSITIARSVTFALDGALLPLVPTVADFFAHANVQSSFTLDGEPARLRVMVNATYHVGDEVFVSFGNLSNTEILLNTGKFVDANPHDEVRLAMSVREDDPFFAAKTAVLDTHGLGKHHLFRLAPSGLPLDLLQAVRVQLMKASEMDRFDHVFTGKGYISLDNELAAYRQILSAADTLIAAYPTSLKDDVEMLQKQTDMAYRKKLAVYLRATEKAILRRTMETVALLWHRILIDGFQL
eukprot:TRINITY_DN17046_c0_g1::TRINITY_DN17046_c0_g1_i1::g.20973::m.20973 TRINITY_DN17046_c0_g1::TRINITY_DN17046_c0_g1_i1::g.20973  ORF type:complete len:434 (+),score=148.97,sp/B0VX69/SETD3_CALJA/30.05/4e-46,Rubis-subs-bind/PF09273.6/2.9e-19 TRINITY_DN17046_c0_g1_i1:29-1303(+)